MPANYVAENPTSALAQSIRTVHMGITLCGIQPAPKTILMTSVQPGEGKTTTSSCLARVRAAAGVRVIVVDLDFYRPGIAKAMDVTNETGFADVLAGQAMLAEVIRQDEKSDASYITSGNVVAGSADLLDANNTRKIFDLLANHYDLIIVDSPPLMAVAESRLLTSIADATILVVRWGHTKRDMVSLGIRQIVSAGGRLAGVVLSQVDVKKNSQYGYPDSGAYHGALSNYYHG
jgi:capsular exopolysaccharide synthesis family protein